MNIAQRLEEAEQKFNKLEQDRQAINEEMVKLQGEWRLLKELNEEPKHETPKVKVKGEK